MTVLVDRDVILFAAVDDDDDDQLLQRRQRRRQRRRRQRFYSFQLRLAPTMTTTRTTSSPRSAPDDLTTAPMMMDPGAKRALAILMGAGSICAGTQLFVDYQLFECAGTQLFECSSVREFSYVPDDVVRFLFFLVRTSDGNRSSARWLHLPACLSASSTTSSG